MAIIMGKGCLEALYGLMGWKGLGQLKCEYITFDDTIYTHRRSFI